MIKSYIRSVFSVDTKDLNDAITHLNLPKAPKVKSIEEINADIFKLVATKDVS